jgi:CRP-like cAMP-binding protein
MSQSANKLLAALPPREYQRLRPMLRSVHLPAESPLPHCGQTRVYFPGTGLCSIINKMADGRGIEVACIGNEGVVGINALTGESPAERNGFVQVADGTVEYMPVVFFERELARNERFRELIDRFCHSFLGTVIQAVACNRLHTTDERCCRWLLGVHDRLGRGRFELKVRFLARAMGVKNSEVAAIIASLEDHGLVQHDGQSITILDTIGLRRLACGCYAAMKQTYSAVVAVDKPKALRPATARVLPMRAAANACTLCGSTTRLPHTNSHACILALDEEIASAVRRTHTLRKYRAQLLADRAQLYRNILKRTN